MKNICTVSDINYLPLGLTMYESIKNHTEDFVLHYLCIDGASFEKLKPFECDTLKVHGVDHFLESDNILLGLKNS